MFPLHQSDKILFKISSTPQHHVSKQQDLILGQAAMVGSNCTKNMGESPYRKLLATKDGKDECTNDTNKKKMMRRDIERQGRQEMASLFASLRSQLPIEYIKGKRSISDQMNVAVNYVEHLQKKIKEGSSPCHEEHWTSSFLGFGGLVSLTLARLFSSRCSTRGFLYNQRNVSEMFLLHLLLHLGRATGDQIAVKRLKAMSAKAEMEFAVEVEILGRVRHKNLLGLRGFYAGGEERLIVYDYMPNHSLITHLHGQLAADLLLDWPRRMSVAIGSAEGLAARKPIEKLPGGVKRDIVQWATPYVQKGAFEHIADPRLKGKYDKMQLKSTIMIAMRCTDGNPENRPSMMEVVEWLKGGIGARKKEVMHVKEMFEEDEVGDDDETDYEGYGMTPPTIRTIAGRKMR
ncbi:hypothetical protein L1049_019665 [Liquidambar formosana]|uniref:Uncharacterized protein n=1 Tax=Liquidambar formosana TaxID=63359 RepID=A0AAP0X5F6_LIQFO